jgi:molecular chaperone HscB
MSPSLLQGDQVYAQQQSSLANKAYSTLKEPLSRANYMLELLGAPIHETESLNEPELLMEVMEARELLEEAQTEDEVQDLKNVNDGKLGWSNMRLCYITETQEN